MAVRGKQYSKEYERVYAKTGSAKKAHAAASTVASTIRKIPKKKKSTWVSRLKKNVQMMIKGPKYYSSIGGKHGPKKIKRVHRRIEKSTLKPKKYIKRNY